MAVDGAGNLYIADTWNHRIRRVDAGGNHHHDCGDRGERLSGDGGAAVLYNPRGWRWMAPGSLYIADSGYNRIRRVDVSGRPSRPSRGAGSGFGGFGGDGGPAWRRSWAIPDGVAVDGAGNLYIADTWNDRIRRVDVSGTITTVAGIGEGSDSGGAGPAAEAVLHWPQGVAVDGSGNVYIADTYNHRIRRVDGSGTLTTIAGTGQ